MTCWNLNLSLVCSNVNCWNLMVANWMLMHCVTTEASFAVRSRVSLMSCVRIISPSLVILCIIDISSSSSMLIRDLSAPTHTRLVETEWISTLGLRQCINMLGWCFIFLAVIKQTIGFWWEWARCLSDYHHLCHYGLFYTECSVSSLMSLTQ